MGLLKKRRRIQFTNKYHPTFGILSMVMGIAVWVFMIILFIISGISEGMSGIVIGIFGLLILIVAIIGLVMGVKCKKEEDIYTITPNTGIVLNTLMVLLCLILYIVGIL